MSEETLRKVYGHHHPDYMRGAAEGIRRRKTTSNASPMKSPETPATKREHSAVNIDKNVGLTDT
jgi:hypothetical protein